MASASILVYAGYPIIRGFTRTGCMLMSIGHHQAHCRLNNWSASNISNMDSGLAHYWKALSSTLEMEDT
jgi:hypothetical protein